MAPPEGQLWGSRRSAATLPHRRISFSASSEGDAELGAPPRQRGGSRDLDVDGLLTEVLATLGRLTSLAEETALLVDPRHEEVLGNLGQLTREVQAASAAMAVCAEVVSGLQHKAVQLSSKTAELEADLEQAQELCEQAAMYQKERDDGRRRVTVLENEMHALQDMHAAQVTTLSSLQVERSDAQRRDEAARRQTVWLEGAMEHAETRVSILTAEVSRLEGELERATIASRSYAALAEESDSCILELQAELGQRSTEAWAGTETELQRLRVQLREQEMATRVAKTQNEDLLRRMTLVSDMLAMEKDPPKEFYIGEADDDGMSDVSTQLPGEKSTCKASTGFLFSDSGTEDTVLKSSPLVRAEASPKGEIRTRIRNAMHAHQPAGQGVSVGQCASTREEAAKLTSEQSSSRKVRASLPATKKSNQHRKSEAIGGELSFLPISW